MTSSAAAVALGSFCQRKQISACSPLHGFHKRCSVTALRTSSKSYLRLRALAHGRSTPKSRRPSLRYCTPTAAETQSAPFRRRGRRYRDSLLDNIEADQAVAVRDRKQRLQKPQEPGQHQPNRRAAFPPPADPNPEASSSSNTTEVGVGWGEDSRGPDDWGWGLDNPTLAAATGSYESELQAKNGKSGSSSSQPAFSDAGDNWDDTELEEDWGDELADGDTPEPSPDVTVLSSREVDQLLKVVPQQQQVQYYGGTPVDLGVRVGTGLVLTIAASKLPLLAAGTLCYPLWWPIYKAWSQNQKLRSSYRYVGLWQTSVLSLDLAAPAGGLQQQVSNPVVKFLFGDASSARTQVDVPYNQRYEDVHVGESAELLLLSNTPDFSSFKALKEVYLPESGVWIAKYPFVDRDVFLDISLDIARERQSQ
ncbi:TPA: hypothetical protein ACH3X1_015142 [Trebouxia sp. C0004]